MVSAGDPSIVQLVLNPEVLDLGWGHPAPDLLPVAGLQRATAAALTRHGPESLAYGNPAGPGPLIDWLIARTERLEGRAPAPGEVMITGGVSLAIDQLCTLLTAPGDVALVESPTYHLAVRILRDHPLELVPMPIDLEGLRVDLLPAMLAQLRREGRRPRLLYTVPTFHNPTGISLSMARRRALVELAAAEGLLVIEDDAYRELTYDGPAPPSLWSLAPVGTVVRLNSFAKVVAPGLRLGWLTADANVVARMTTGGLLDSGGGINHFAAVTMLSFCEGGDYEEQGARLRAAYRARRDALADGLAEYLPPGCAWDVPAGGLFIWVRLPAGIDAEELLPRATAAGVSFLPGARFHLDGNGRNTLRLAYGLYPPADLAMAARRLGTVLRALS